MSMMEFRFELPIFHITAIRQLQGRGSWGSVRFSKGFGMTHTQRYGVDSNTLFEW